MREVKTEPIEEDSPELVEVDNDDSFDDYESIEEQPSGQEVFHSIQVRLCGKHNFSSSSELHFRYREMMKGQLYSTLVFPTFPNSRK